MANSKKDAYEVNAISCGKDHTLVLLNTGSVLGWGGSGSGNAGNS